MSVMLLSVTGVPEPWFRLVSVQDKTEFVGTMRILAMKEAIGLMLDNEDAQADLLRCLKVRLDDTGLEDYPEDYQSQQELQRRFI